MPTHDELAQFLREFAALSLEQQKQFIKAVIKLVNDLRAGQGFRPGLRIKGARATRAFSK